MGSGQAAGSTSSKMAEEISNGIDGVLASARARQNSRVPLNHTYCHGTSWASCIPSVLLSSFSPSIWLRPSNEVEKGDVLSAPLCHTLAAAKVNEARGSFLFRSKNSIKWGKLVDTKPARQLI
uniref:Uncharacterized protein n=1 Tax=Trypanosoma congolense (strain IL3000) TaxID=1068625 RepID=G0UNF4_TRYCI|nr:hypothetical protein, unlikely [Trypanosoma congolense IL3000]